jgi:predicted  nucleic acid-binding Zn-ribbon protein
VGEDRTGGNSAGASGWVTTQVAAEALGVDPRTVRTYIRRGLLDAKVEGEGVEKAYSVDVDSLYALRESRKPPRKAPHKIREKSAGKLRLGEASEDLAELVRDLTAQAIRSSSEAAALRARLQLTERAQSTLEEEARELREERDRLRAELEAERSKGFWARLF